MRAVNWEDLDGRELEQEMQRCRQHNEAFRDMPVFRESSFDKDNGAVPQMAEAKRYADHWSEMKQNGIGLLLWGAVGSGKSFAAACIANAVFDCGQTARMTTLGAVLRNLPALSPQEKNQYLSDLLHCDLLVLDDFGTERRTDYGKEQIFALIDGRYLTGKPMIVTTNLTLQELKHPQDLALQRVCDRILERCVPVCFDGANLRQTNAKAQMALYKSLTRP